MKKIFLFIFVMLYGLVSNAQYAPLDYAIKLNALSPLNLVNPSVQLQFERAGYHGFSTESTTGVIFYPTVSGIFSNRGVVLGLEERFYVNRNGIDGLYMGISYQYLKNDSRQTGEFIDHQTDTFPDYFAPTYTDTYMLHRQTHSVSLKYGYAASVGHFLIDFFVGIGIKYRSVSHSERDVPEDIMGPNRHPNIFYYSNREQQRCVLFFPVGFSMGYRF